MTGAQNRAIEEITSDQAKPKRAPNVARRRWLGKNACRIMGANDGSWGAGRVLRQPRFCPPASCQYLAMFALFDIEIGFAGQGRGKADEKPPPLAVLSRKTRLKNWHMAACHWWLNACAIIELLRFTILAWRLLTSSTGLACDSGFYLAKKAQVDVMVMTATPAKPAMTAYGDLDHPALTKNRLVDC